MNIYRPDEEFLLQLKEWSINNKFTFNPSDYGLCKVTSVMKGQAPWNKGIPNTWGEKISKSTKGKPRRFTKQMDIARKNAEIRNKTMLECIHCGKVNNVGNHHRYHGDKCKIFTSSLSSASC